MGISIRSWAAYAHYQNKLSRSFRLDSHAWGLEGALNVILRRDFSVDSTTEDEFRRAAGNASRKRRDHIARFLAEPHAEVDVPDSVDLSEQVAAADMLDMIGKSIEHQEDLVLLSEIAEGGRYDQLARSLGRPASSLRSRVLRLRERLAPLRAA